jgi:hypothetical protein
MRTRIFLCVFSALTISVFFTQCKKEEEKRKDYDNGYYIGEFNEKGERHGQGTYYWNSGDIYDGAWKESHKHGLGTFTFKDGSTFTCEWKDGEPTDEKCYFLWTFKGWYFWKDEIGKIDAKEYTSAEDLLAKRKYTQDTLSSIENIATDKHTLSWAGKKIGYGFGMRWDTDNNLRVAYVYANSQGSLNGLKRGWKITHINGGDVKTMTTIPSNIEEKEGMSRSFTVEDENGTSKVLFLSASAYSVQTVLHNSIIKHKQKNIGYLVLRSFISQDQNALLSAASSLAGSGISELVLDLRYCSGGSYLVLNEFVNLIAPNSLNNREYMKTNYNSDHTDNNVIYTVNKTGSLNFNRIFVITSATTANVPEYLINGLSPYMNLIIIGDKTSGYIYDISYWTFGQKRHYLVDRKISNAQNESPINGISPNFSVVDGVDKNWADENEDCLSTALFYIDNGHFPKSLTRKNASMQNDRIIESVNQVEALPAPKEKIYTIKD